jgi:hypothetical protein
MLSLTPGDLIAKMKVLFIVVLSLFSGMWLGATMGFVLDRRARQRAVTRLCQPEAGFRETEEGTWVWRFSLEELSEALAPPRGSAVVISAIIGMPFARLRAALPDDLVLSTMASALGRRSAFSVAGMSAALPAQKRLLRWLSAVGRRAPREPEEDAPRAVALRRAAQQDGAPAEAADACCDGAAKVEQLEELVGTALVLGKPSSWGTSMHHRLRWYR